ncbi:aldo/keto reductase [Chitinophaga sp. Cy-1792]|uniref:aldo/keto reductase n=1 Tax=Chitinophaga sp. Cy-1792 TaxID=2608339 RepID=UPI00142240B0|nr:aldo/keto reductase [Chitinophaga sp. Cy-1792]NIG56850.1 aldo/keto reductase [Chitinophaga sp. Cy-1792]
MKYNQLGKSALQVSEIAFGCMSLTKGAADNIRLIHAAMAAGINLFDTADLYDHGDNERMLGEALKDTRREEVIIATKVGNQWRADKSGWDWNPRKDYIIAAVEESLRRLHTDYIDLYQLHGGTIEDPVSETIEAFETLVQQGKIRYYGISSIRPEVIRAYVQQSNIVSVMMQYSLLDRRPEEAALPLLLEHNIGVLARGTVAKGLLAGKEPASYLNFSADQVAAAAAAVARESVPGRGPAETAIRYVLQQPAVSSAVLGIRTDKHLQDALAADKAPALDEKTIAALSASIPANVYEQYR